MNKRPMRVISIILMLMLVLTSFAFASVPEDVTGQTYEDAVQTLMDRGAITGDTDGLYHPNDNLNRAQACAIVVRAINPPASELTGTATQLLPGSGFDDMAGYTWAEPYIRYAVKNGITKGVGDNKFNPAGNVKYTELLTFVLRAAGYSDEALGGQWPDNYVAKANVLNLNTGMPSEMPLYATKWMTAQFTFNGLDLIDAYAKERPDTGDIVLKGLTYVMGAFDGNISTFDNIALDKNVRVYAYEAKKNYKKTMTLSTKKNDYREMDVNKYKAVSSPAWLLMSEGKVTQIILPYDVGFTGKIYGLINSFNRVLNGKGETVDGVNTWAAMKEIEWFGKEGLVLPTPVDGDGVLYELSARNGEITNITTAGGVVTGKHFVEITSPSGFTLVADFDRTRGIIGISDGGTKYYSVKENASVYVVKSDKTYEAGSLSSIRKGKEVRLYDISDDKETNVDIIVVK